MGSEKRATAREEGKEKREERREMVLSQTGGMVEKRVGLWKKKREKRRETREEQWIGHRRAATHGRKIKNESSKDNGSNNSCCTRRSSTSKSNIKST